MSSPEREPRLRWDGDELALDRGRAHVRFTTRRGGVSAGAYASANLGLGTADDPVAVAANRAALAERHDVALAGCYQVHGTQIHVREAPPAPDEERPIADGQATTRPGVGLLVLVADCLPIVLLSDEAVGVVHAGWRGLGAGVIENGMATVQRLGGRNLVAAIGPGAGVCCYEAGPEVHAAIGHSAAANVDLKAAATERLRAAGAAAVIDAGLCTLCAPDGLLFSHRRDGGITGRQGGLGWLS